MLLVRYRGTNPLVIHINCSRHTSSCSISRERPVSTTLLFKAYNGRLLLSEFLNQKSISLLLLPVPLPGRDDLFPNRILRMSSGIFSTDLGRARRGCVEFGSFCFEFGVVCCWNYVIPVFFLLGFFAVVFSCVVTPGRTSVVMSQKFNLFQDMKIESMGV